MVQRVLINLEEVDKDEIYLERYKKFLKKSKIFHPKGKHSMEALEVDIICGDASTKAMEDTLFFIHDLNLSKVNFISPISSKWLVIFEEFTLNQDVDITFSIKGVFSFREWKIYYKNKDKLSFIQAKEIGMLAKAENKVYCDRENDSFYVPFNKDFIEITIKGFIWKRTVKIDNVDKSLKQRLNALNNLDFVLQGKGYF